MAKRARRARRTRWKQQRSRPSQAAAASTPRRLEPGQYVAPLMHWSPDLIRAMTSRAAALSGLAGAGEEQLVALAEALTAMTYSVGRVIFETVADRLGYDPLALDTEGLADLLIDVGYDELVDLMMKGQEREAEQLMWALGYVAEMRIGTPEGWTPDEGILRELREDIEMAPVSDEEVETTYELAAARLLNQTKAVAAARTGGSL
jgi:hypothetical protein